MGPQWKTSNLRVTKGVPGSLAVKGLPAKPEMQEARVRSLGQEEPLEEGMASPPVGRGAWRATVHGVAESWTQQRAHVHTHTHTHARVLEGFLSLGEFPSVSYEVL